MSFMPLDVNVRVLGAANAKAQLTGVGNSMQQVGTKADMMNKRLAANKSNIRGLAIGLSTVFGTITGVVAEFQLLGDAQQKVAADTELLNKLQAEGKKGTTEWSRAQASLAKDMRFLSFSTRNLALVLANFIPEAILIATSLVNMRRAQALYKLQVAESIAANQGLSASNMEVATTNKILATSFTPLGTAMRTNARYSTEMAAGFLAAGGAPLANLNNNLLTFNKTGVATPGIFAKMRAGLVSFGAAATGFLRKFGPVILIIGSVIALSEAFKNNWGGFGDIMNDVGVKVGNAVPALKGALDVMKKIALSISAIVELRFGDLGAIWSGTTKEMEDANEELIKSIEELDKASRELILDLSGMDKKDLGEKLDFLGIKGGAEKRMKSFLQTVEHFKERLTGFVEGLETIRQVNILEKLGFDVPQSLWKKFAFTMEDRFRKMAKELGGGKNNPLNLLADELEKTAKLGNVKGSEAIAKYLINNPEILKYVEQFVPDLFPHLKAIVDEQLAKQLSTTSAEIEGIGDDKLGLVTDAGKRPTLEYTVNLFTPGGKPFSIQNFLAEVASTNLSSPENALNVGLGPGGSKFGQDVFAQLLGFKDSNDLRNQLGVWFNDHVVVPISTNLTLAKQRIDAFIATNPVLGPIATFLGDPLGAIAGLGQWFNDHVLVPIVQNIELVKTRLENYIRNTPILGDIINLLFPKDMKPVDANIPIKPSFTFADKAVGGGAFSAEVETDSSAQLGALTQAYFDNIKPISVDNVPITPNSLLISDVEGAGGGSGLNARMKEGVQLKMSTPIDIIPSMINIVSGGEFDPFGVVLAQMVVKISITKEKITQLFKEIEVAAQQLQTGLANLAIQGANSLGILADASSSSMNGIANNFSVGEVAAQDLQTGLANLSNEGIKSMSALAKASSSMANGIKNNMKVAVAAVNSLRNAINSLKSKTVTVKVQVSNSKAEGGLMSFAEGGLMSAAKGRMFTAHGEQLVKVGDNPGGNETVAFIPHNNPYPIVDRILEMFGTRANAGGAFGRSRMGGGSNNCPIIVQVYMDNQRMENHLVKTITRRAAAFK